MEQSLQTQECSTDVPRVGQRSDTVRLIASRDRASGKSVFPCIPAQSPAASRYETIKLSEEATLYSFTVIHPNPKAGEKPFVVVYADFPEGARVFGRLENREGEHPQIGMMLRVIVKERSEASGQYFFEPAREGLR